eukprot:3368974-Amphidinium_carterae.2
MSARAGSDEDISRKATWERKDLVWFKLHAVLTKQHIYIIVLFLVQASRTSPRPAPFQSQGFTMLLMLVVHVGMGLSESALSWERVQ